MIESSRITTSRLCSTRRFAFSITISATCTWRVAGSSKVEEIDLAFTVALHVGHLLGPLVDQQHDQVGLGVVLAMALAMSFRIIVLPVRGAAT